MKYIVPENVGKSEDIVGIDYFVLHYACWANEYSDRLKRAGIFGKNEEIPVPAINQMTIPYGYNAHIIVVNPRATFADLVNVISILAYSETKFRRGEITEIPVDIPDGADDIEFLGMATSDCALTRACGYSSDCGENLSSVVESIDRSSELTIHYRVKGDEKFKGTDMEGKRISKTGKIIENRTIRIFHKYVRKPGRGRGQKNTLIFDADFVKKCHLENYTIKYKELHKLKNDETTLGLYLFLLGNKPKKGKDSRFHAMYRIQKFFQLVLPREPKTKKQSELDLYNAQLVIYKEVQEDFCSELGHSLDKLQSMGLISGWKPCIYQKDKRATTEYVNLAKVRGLKIWK